MAAIIVEMSEFQQNLPMYIASKDVVEITRDGETVGYFGPKQPRKDPDWDEWQKGIDILQAEMAARGVTEEDISDDFFRARAEERAARRR